MGGWSRRFMLGTAALLGATALGLAGFAAWEAYRGLQPNPPEPRTLTVVSRLEEPVEYRLRIEGVGGSDSGPGLRMTMGGKTIRAGDSFSVPPGTTRATVTPLLPRDIPTRQYARQVVFHPEETGPYLTEKRFDFFVHVQSFWDHFGLAIAAGLGMVVSLFGCNFLACRVRRRPPGRFEFNEWPPEVEEGGRPWTGLRRLGRHAGPFWKCGEVRIGRSKWRNELVLPHSSVPSRAATVRRHEDPQSGESRVQIRAEPGRTVYLYEREGMTDQQARLSGGQWADLTGGDELQIGDYRLTYRR